MSQAIFAFIAEADHQSLLQPGSWMDRFPPALFDPVSEVWLLERPRALVAVQEEEGVFVYRISAGGEFGGDSWHPTFDEAKHDVAVEFGGSAIEHWTDVPVGVEDPIRYVAEQLPEDP